MSKVREILLDLLDKTTKDALAHKTSVEGMKGNIDSALASLLSVIEEKIPKEKKCFRCGAIDYNDHAISCKTKLEQKGYNLAIQDLKQNLREELGG